MQEARQDTWIQFLGDIDSVPGSGRSPREGHGSPCSILAWRIQWTKETGRLQSMGSKSWTQLKQLSMHSSLKEFSSQSKLAIFL